MSHMQRIPVAIVVTLLALSTANASTLAPPVSNLALFCGTGSSVTTIGVAARDCEASLGNDSLSAMAETLQTLYAGSGAAVSGDAGVADGRAELLFQLAVSGGDGAPFQPAAVPLLLTAVATVTTVGDAVHDVVADARLGVTNLLALQLLGNGGGQLRESVSIDLAADVPASVVLATLCQARGAPTGSVCMAMLQFGVRLDQAAFDAAYGAGSYRLDDFYAVEVSAGLRVPLPGALGLLLAALCATACAGQLVPNQFEAARV